jgi:hypothetical protein
MQGGADRVYAVAERTYYLAPGDAVVYHRRGLTTNGWGYLESVTSINIPGTITVCARLHTGFGYDDVYPVIDHGITSGVNWAIEAVPQYNYRIRVVFGDGEASVDVPGEMHTPHIYCFRVRSEQGAYYLDVFVDGRLYAVIPRNRSMVTGSNPIIIGAYHDFSKFGKYTTITLFLVFSRTLSDSEIAGIANGIIPYNGLIVYFDPTIFHYYQGVYVDLSGNGNHFRVGAPLTAYTDYINMFVIRGRYTDAYVHFLYFPWYSRIEIYNYTTGELVRRFTVGGVDNGYGLVMDYPVYLIPGEYTIVYYDPNEGVTTTVTMTETWTETVTRTETITSTETVTMMETVTRIETVTNTVVVPIYRTVTETATVTVAVEPRWDWIVVVLMMVLGASCIYYKMRQT